MNNLKLFTYSCSKPEPLLDTFYIKDSPLIISTPTHAHTLLMQAYTRLIECITAYKTAHESNNMFACSSLVLEIHTLLATVHDLHFSEFVCFWSTCDVSFTVYEGLPKSEQLVFLETIIQKYIELRHCTYVAHGYSATTLQVSKDAKAHKMNGPLGNEKVASILREFEYMPIQQYTLSEFLNADKCFLFADKTGKKLFSEICIRFKIAFNWSHHHQNKMPDVLFKNGDALFITEHKHMKEGGGGQDKQATEVIDFIAHEEPNAPVPVHYVSFLDGLYFNLLAQTAHTHQGKLKSQIAHIKTNLERYPSNYFVNTEGFYALLRKFDNV